MNEYPKYQRLSKVPKVCWAIGVASWFIVVATGYLFGSHHETREFSEPVRVFGNTIYLTALHQRIQISLSILFAICALCGLSVSSYLHDVSNDDDGR